MGGYEFGRLSKGVIDILGIERRQLIMEILKQNRKIYVTALSKHFSVTEETVRRDLEKLEKDGLLTRSYGGAVLKEHTNEDLPFPRRTVINSDLKEAIAIKAADLINDGDTLMIDSSTTGLALIRHLIGKKNLTIITNSVRLINDFADSGFNFLSTGGTLRAHSYALVGTCACAMIRNYYVDLAVIGCKGIDQERGIMESNEAESAIKQVMIAQAEKKLLLVDHTKFNTIAFTKTADIDEIDYIITDCTPSAAWLDFLQSKQIRLIV